MNTCKTVSKQRTSTTFRMNTYKKPQGGSLGPLHHSIDQITTPLAPRMTTFARAGQPTPTGASAPPKVPPVVAQSISSSAPPPQPARRRTPSPSPQSPKEQNAPVRQDAKRKTPEDHRHRA